MNTMPRPIETSYAGCRFRSRLEARWAVFFDTLGLEWVYEKEGFDLGPAGWYLPDFWVPNWRTWVEIKPGEPTAEESAKIEAFGASQPLLLVCGQPWIGRHSIRKPGDPEGWLWGEFTTCRRCNGIALLADDDVHHHGFYGDAGIGTHTCEPHDKAPVSGALLHAYKAARGARFERGKPSAA